MLADLAEDGAEAQFAEVRVDFVVIGVSPLAGFEVESLEGGFYGRIPMAVC